MQSKQKKGTNSKIRMDASKYYNTGSAAPLVQPEYPNTYKPKTKPKRQHKTKEEIQIEKQQIFEKALYHLKFLFTSVVILSCCIAMMMFNATILEKKRDINILNSQLKELKDKNLSLEATVSESLNLEYIEKEARERLGMGKPTKPQIVYIDVPKSDYTVQYDVEIKPQKKGILDSIKDFILNLES